MIILMILKTILEYYQVYLVDDIDIDIVIKMSLSQLNRSERK